MKPRPPLPPDPGPTSETVGRNHRTWPIFVIVVALFGVLALGVSACGDEDLDSRGGERIDIDRNSDSDELLDVEWVMAFRNVRRVPNLFVACLAHPDRPPSETVAMVTTSSGESGASGRAIERVPEFDDLCVEKITGARDGS